MTFAAMRRYVPILLPLAELMWLYPWVLLLSGALYLGEPSVILAPVAVLVLLTAGYLAATWFATRSWPVHRVKFALLAVAVGTGLWAVWMSHYSALPIWDLRWAWMLLLAAHDVFPHVPTQIVGALAAPLLFWRGLVLGDRGFSHFEADRTFRRGVAWWVTYVLIFAVYAESRAFRAARGFGAYLLAFFFVSLVMLAVARLIEIWEESRGRTTAALSMNRPWLTLLVALVGTIVLLGTWVGGLAGMDVRGHLVPLGRALSPLLELIFMPLFFVASLIARVILLALELLPRRTLPPIERPPNPIGDLLRRVRDMDFSPEAISAARWGMVAAVVVLLSLILLFVVIRARRRLDAGGGDDRESVWDSAAMWHSLRGLLRRRKPRRAQAQEMGGSSEVVAVRQLYRRFLAAAARVGIRRRIDQTPSEFADTLGPPVAVPHAAVAQLTGAYERVRYGEVQPSRAEVMEAERAFGEIDAALSHE